MSIRTVSRPSAAFLALATMAACSAEDLPVPADQAPAGEAPAPVSAALVQPPPDATALPAARDTSIRLSAPNRNFGRDAALDVNRTLVAFDQSALRAAVGAQDYLVSAALELTLTGNNLRPRQPARTVAAHRLTKHWTEAGATWNCAVDAQPTNSRADCSGATAWSMGPLPPNPFVVPATAEATIAPQQTGIVRFDVTADVRGFLSGSLPNHGWMLRSGLLGVFAEFLEFASRESATPPRLLLTVRRCSPSICDDGNACTADSCDAQALCVNANAPDGTTCNDGNMCSAGDMCQAGVCQPGGTDTCAPPPVVINEIESSGGSPGDWVELHNRGAAAVDLSGFIFKDGDDTHVYTIPAGTSIAPGGYLILEEAQFGFGLGSPDAARLFMPNGTTLVDAHSWTPHATPTSYGRCPDATGGFTITSSVTKGAVNDCSVQVVINEIESSGGSPGDWVELFNKGPVTVDLSGFVFKDGDDTHVYTIPAGTSIAPGAYLTLEEAQFGFGLGSPDSARLFMPNGTTLVDSHAWTPHAATSYGRCPNGSGAFTTTASVTKAAANDCGFVPPPVVINEVESSGGSPGDWVELYNRGSTAVDLSGFIFRDNVDTDTYVLPSGSIIAPGGYLVLDEAQFVFGLGGADSARLFGPDGTTVIDSFAWTTHATPTSYGRCPNGTGATFTTTVSVTKAAANECTGGISFSPWPGSSAVSTIDVANSFTSNLSGLTYQPATPLNAGILWAVTNGPSKIYRLEADGTGTWVNSTADDWAMGKTLMYPVGTGAPDSEGVTRGDPTSSAMYVATERDNTVNSVSRMAVLRYDTSTPGTILTALQEWNLTPDLPAAGPNLGLEAITWAADAQLVNAGFFDERQNALYNPASYPPHGGGVFFVGVEGTGAIHAYVLDHTSSNFFKVATIASGQAGVMGLEFDADQGTLWAWCDNTCGNKATLLGITTTSNGRFVVRAGYDRPTGMGDFNNEGIAFAPLSECSAAGQRSFFWCDDSNNESHALRLGTLTCGPLP